MKLTSFVVPIPAIEKDVAAIADYIELNAIASPDSSISANDVATQLEKDEDEDEDRGVADHIPDYIAAAFNEVQERSLRLGNEFLYPFVLDESGELVTYRHSPSSWLYIFCLVATRANMQKNRYQKLGEVRYDGATLFEQITPHVLIHYAHVDKFLVMGTGRISLDPVGLAKAIGSFLLEYGESGSYQNVFEHGESNDGGCDVIAWHSHSDPRPGKSTLFCSCKTGSSWKESLDFVPSPERWSRAYVSSRAFTVMPIPCLAVTEALSRKTYAQKVEEHQLLAFDRTRIAYAQANIPSPLRSDCLAWLSLATKRAFDFDLAPF